MNLQEHVALAPFTTFGIGGPARWFIEVRSEGEIEEAAAFACERQAPLFVLGGGSNLLVSDDGYPGLVVRVALAGIEEDDGGAGRRIFRVAAGEDWDALVTHTVAKECAGMECLAGIPGTAGGTPVQNVGAYGQEVAETIVGVRGYDLKKQSFVEWSAAECEFAYRSSRFNTRDRRRYILTRVDYALTQKGEPKVEYADLKCYFQDSPVKPSLATVAYAVRTIRRGKGMVLAPEDPDGRSAGSFFKNPVVAAASYERIAAEFHPAAVPHYPAVASDGGEQRVKIPAAWLLEKAGFMRGFARGEAGISSRHTLALINRGHARAADILALRDEITGGVWARFGIRLEPEPVFVC